MDNIVTLFNQTRCQNEGNVEAAEKAALACGFPAAAARYVGLSANWRSNEEGFRQICREIADDPENPEFWGAAVLESLGAVSPAGQEKERLAYFDQAEQRVAHLELDNKIRLYIETCVAAGRNETAGQTRHLSVFRRVAQIMIEEGWYNAANRLKVYLDEILKTGGDVEQARDLIDAFAAKEQSGDHNFSARQTGFLKKDHGALFPAS